MTLEEIDAQLAAMPASPEDRDTILARADLARKRIELLEAARRHELPQPLPGEIAVCVPDGISCILTVTDQVRFAERLDGQLVIKMGWADFARLVRSRDGGHRWAEQNPALVQQLASFNFSF
jgi:hypothetical protein